MAPAVNAEANATAKTNFFTIFSVVFRGVEQAMDGLNGSYHHSRPAELSVLLLFVAVVFRFGGRLAAKKNPPAFWGRRIVAWSDAVSFYQGNNAPRVVTASFVEGDEDRRPWQSSRPEPGRRFFREAFEPMSLDPRRKQKGRCCTATTSLVRDPATRSLAVSDQLEL